VLFNCNNQTNKVEEKTVKAPEGMVWVPSKTFLQGAKEGDVYAMEREKPGHLVSVDGFFIDKTEVTNAQFKKFVKATGYKTLAERPIDWEQLKKDLPTGTPKPADSLLLPGSLVFNKNVDAVVNMNNYNQWWMWKIGANWQHPEGPKSSIEGKDNFPVVHVAYEDALAYCKWANRMLPTESQWEAAAQGARENEIYTWGKSNGELLKNANTWQGQFPINNLGTDGFMYLSEVKSFEANSLGIYDMIGNVWEMTSDRFDTNYYKTLNPNTISKNPKGSTKFYNPQNPYAQEMVMKGGSFLCHESYCASYRISARMGTTIDTGSDHLGFRTIATKEMVLNNKTN